MQDGIIPQDQNLLEEEGMTELETEAIAFWTEGASGEQESAGEEFFHLIIAPLLISTIYKSLKHTLSLVILLCLHQPFPG
jgi:hypothetical protein